MVPVNTQKQQELFEEFVIREKRKGRFLGAFRFKKPLFPQHRLNIAISYEALIILLISLVLTASIVFSLGVERGRNLDFAEAPMQPATDTKVKEAQVQSTEKPVPIDVQRQPEVAPKEQQIQKAVPATTEEKAFTIQVATFKTRTLAERESLRLKNIGYSSDVLKKKEFFIVCVGAYAKRELAQRTLRDLKRLYKDCYVRTR